MTVSSPEEEWHDEGAAGQDLRAYNSLEDALRDRHLPVENQAFVRTLLSALDVEGYFERSGYIKVTRAGGGPAIAIHYGYSNGFRSEDEIVRAVGDVERWPSARGKGLWGVAHPTNRPHSGGGGTKRDRLELGTCTTCGMQLPATGKCDYCD